MAARIRSAGQEAESPFLQARAWILESLQYEG